MLLVGQAGACFEWICGTMPGPDLPNDWIFDPNGWEWFHPTNSRRWPEASSASLRIT